MKELKLKTTNFEKNKLLQKYFCYIFAENKAKTFNKTTGKKTLKRYQKEKTKYDRLSKKFVNYKVV